MHGERAIRNDSEWIFTSAGFGVKGVSRQMIKENSKAIKHIITEGRMKVVKLEEKELDKSKKIRELESEVSDLVDDLDEHEGYVYELTESRKIRTILLTCLAICMYFFGRLSVAEAAPLTPEQAFEVAIFECIHEDSPVIPEFSKTNAILLGTLCAFAFTENRLLYITSNCRPNSDGYHKFCSAFDFYLDYDSLGIIGDCEVRFHYKIDVISFKDWISFVGISEITGFGIYTNLTMHIDTSKRRRRWAFDENGNQIPFALGMELLDKRIEEVCD